MAEAGKGEAPVEPEPEQRSSPGRSLKDDFGARVGAICATVPLALPPDPSVGYALAMTVTLCIETSSVYCSLALAVEDQDFCRHEELQRRHNEEVLPLLDALYQEAGVAPRETGLIGFGAGPGSFTGVRIAASIAQGLAMASECLVVPMAGSEILLHSALAEPSLSAALASSSAEATKTWLTVVPSRAEAYYLALYSHSREDGAEVITAVHEDRLYTNLEWLKAGTTCSEDRDQAVRRLDL